MSPTDVQFPTDAPAVAIIGGGLTGTACAIHMVRAASRRIAIDIFEPRAVLGGGIAYGSAAAEHRINVPSDRMTIFSDRPKDFSEWLDRTGLRDTDPEAWVPGGHYYSTRQVFRAYMADLARETSASNPFGSTIEHVREAVEDVTRLPAAVAIGTPSSASRIYTAAVIAASHAAPSLKWKLSPDASALTGFHTDPWERDRIAGIAKDADVLVVGTGLTMGDIVVTLRGQGHRGRVTAISRHGLLPRAHAEFDSSIDFLAGETLPKSALALLRQTRRKIAEAEAVGLSWRAALDALRRALPTIWPTLSIAERQKALRYLRSFWDVHRYRMAPQVAVLLDEGFNSGWLTIAVGRIRAIGAEGGRYKVSWTGRGGKTEVGAFDAIVNCTGPDWDLRRSQNPLFRSLLGKGIARPDPLGLGLEVDERARVISSAGVADPLLRVAGPLAQFHFGEVMGLPEISGHARFVAESLVADLDMLKGGLAPRFA